ncbi:hypothetical protein AK88_05294 [Plasmodium fragile]|uniref:Schizont-infected cell agglutination extracellular alpha domain-containing protein n=1 Tax=Plasmodium fragile TaxID=5857 RepID=A0A0D9QE46_PLAFR|nr:uncharacterized protein AK88_05294 [Plasmodium fragile]KJP85072.1 hypothetical protein AK88_05294 [Plasmodium fragile]
MKRQYKDDDEKQIDLYMRCILVNIFMKKIMGMKCLKRPGGHFAFGLAKGLIHDVHRQALGNVACEWKDADKGGDAQGKSAQDRDLWDIMQRWNENNRLKIGDGDWGVLGAGCHVEKKGRAKVGDADDSKDLKEKVKEEISNVQEDIKVKVSKILKGIGVCSDGDDNCVKKLLEQERDREKNDQDSRSKALGDNGPSQGDVKTSSTARPPRPSRPTAEPSSPGVGTAGLPAVGTSDTKATHKPALAKPAPAKPAPAKPAPPAKPVAPKPATAVVTTTTSSGGGGRSGGTSGAGSTGGGQAKKAETQEKCQGQTILDWRPTLIYVEHGYSVSNSTQRTHKQDRKRQRHKHDA